MPADLLPLIDPHHHLWDLTLYDYPWLAPRPAPDPQASIRQSYLLDDFLADTRHQNLVKSVHVQAEVARHQSVAETAWLQSIADLHGFPHGIVAFAPLADDNVAAMLEAHAQYPNMRGIRQLLNWHQAPARSQCERPDYLTDGRWQAGYALLATHNLSYDLQAYPVQLPDAATLAGRFPQISMIVNHTGMPFERSADALQVWRTGMRLLAERPNTSVKISGLGMSDPHWTTDSLRPLVLETIDIFGVERCMFASNFPVDKIYGSFDTLFDAFKAITADFSESERRALFHDNAERIYRL